MKNAAVVASLTCLAIGAWLLLPKGPWMNACPAILALAGVVLLQGETWRRTALVSAAVAASAFGLDMFATVAFPEDHRPALTRTVVPGSWIEPDAVLGYRLSPNAEVLETARYGDEPVYRAFYHIDEKGARRTAAGDPDAPTYLFLGDSFVFGQGLNDDESLAAQFTRATDGAIRGINLGVPGYAPNHLVRALEAGIIDRHSYNEPRGVVTWIIPAQLARITGDGPWLGSSPHYVLHEGQPKFTGSFARHRWTNPGAGLIHLLQSHFIFARTIGWHQRQQFQAELFVALLMRLQELVRVRLDAPLIVAYSWPDEESHPNYSGSEVPQDLLVEVISELRQRGIPLISMNRLITGKDPGLLFIPHDGHPTAFTNKLLAVELVRLTKLVP